MLDQEINEQLALLQKELGRLKKVTDYIDGAKENSQTIVQELEQVQKNYTAYTDKLFNLYKQYTEDLKRSTEIKINDGVLKFETTGNQIDLTNKEKLVEIKRLLEQYKKIVEATDTLVKTLEAVNFPSRLEKIDSEIQTVNKTLTEKLENTNQRLVLQDKNIKTLKIILFVICGLIVIGIVATVLH